eukprot:432404-Rhodomonas_salina.3
MSRARGVQARAGGAVVRVLGAVRGAALSAPLHAAPRRRRLEVRAGPASASASASALSPSHLRSRLSIRAILYASAICPTHSALCPSHSALRPMPRRCALWLGAVGSAWAEEGGRQSGVVTR